MVAASIRILAASDSLAELTHLLHRAYAPLAAVGLNYTAADQPPDVTAKRIERGECAVAIAGDVLVGTITVEGPYSNAGCPWYRQHVHARRPGLLVTIQRQY